jgi:hypothetical protein
MKRKSFFINRTGTAVMMVCRTRIPVGVRQCLFSAAFVLLRFEAGIGLGVLVLRVMNGAIRLGANLPHFALVDTLGDDGLDDVLARLELRHFAFSGVLGFSDLISTYWLRVMILLPSCVLP